MIGVIANPADREVVHEFFELFKTPWEFCDPNQRYDVLINAGETEPQVRAKLTIVYSGRAIDADDRRGIQAIAEGVAPGVLVYQGNRIPIYGDLVTFAGKESGLLLHERSQECAAYLTEVGGSSRARVGYELFNEIRKLLALGQPRENADIPALELHIAFLRDMITGCGVSLVEIPPIPEGYEFIACLTHDVDHPSIRQHKLDHTILGFLVRALFGSLVDTFFGRMSIRDAATNWAAALKLPLVYMGLAKDFWRDFDERYLAVEQDLPSTFFLIPRKGDPGKGVDSRATALRASPYAARELADTISKLRAKGREVGLHGIDAWIDSSAGREELEEIRRLAGTAEIGVRMHWLCYNEDSPQTLESAGAAYDSTSGYNETVGYRAGTTQAYKPLGAKNLLELPLHAMDTALFYLSYLGLSPQKASIRLRQMADNVAQYGGCLTINWHDRSLAPERLWGGCYRDLIQDLKSRGAWFATASQATAWFRKRRAIAFEKDGSVRAKLAVDSGENLPGLRMRIHEAGKPGGVGTSRPRKYRDTVIGQHADAHVPAQASR